MGNQTRERWAGGYVRAEANGRKTFILQREIGGRRFHRSTGAHNERAALKQLERFEANPGAWNPFGDAIRDILRLTPELVVEFRDYQLSPPPLGAGNTSRKHVAQYCAYLGDFMEAFRGKDLRTLSLSDDVKPALRGKKCLGYRIAAIKAFFTWLRTEKHLVKTAEDCTLDLRSIQASPEKHRRKKALDELAVRKVFDLVTPDVRDVISVLMATGWHTTELERFVRHQSNAEIIETPERTDKIIAILRTRQKSKEMTNTALTHGAHLEAAKRLFARGRMPKKHNDTVKAACDAAGIPRFTLGVMRHTVATWAKKSGASLAEIAAAFDHKDKRTTRIFYVDLNEPTAPIPTIAFHDPRPLSN